jgi:predicted nucleotidyltransferase
MLGTNSYNKLASAKRAMRKKSGMKLSFEDLILDLISRKLELAPIDDRLKRYIEKAALQISNIEGVEGILLFGSVAKGTYNRHSDIDIAVVTSGKKWDALRGVLAVSKSMQKEGYELMDLGLPSLISPVVLDLKDTKSFRPFYFDIADFGIILYERGKVLMDFVNSMRWKSHRREVVGGVEVVTW